MFMSKPKLFLFALLLLFLGACRNEQNHHSSDCSLLSSGDYLIFGTYYGFCAGNCTSLYKLADEVLLEDDISYFEKDKVVSFKTVPLSSDKLIVAENLCEAFPLDKILNEAETVGCPDCHDQGVVYLELKKNGQLRKWYVDPDANQSQVPDYLRNFVQNVKTTIEKLK